MSRKFFLFSLFLSSLALFVACNSKVIDPIIGTDRDEHGCLPSAGYSWSYALHDCVRIWEVGERFESIQGDVFLVFSSDSIFAEVFTNEKRLLLRRKKRHSNEWVRRHGNERVIVQPNGITTIFAQNYYFTKAQKQ